MKLKTNRPAQASDAGRAKDSALGGFWPVDNSRPLRPADPQVELMEFNHPEMERRLRAKRVWEFLDEGKSTFYARMNVDDPSYDPLFPQPIPTSSTGKGPKRWKLGAVIAWLRACETAAHYS